MATQRYAVDRVEGDYIVLISDEDCSALDLERAKYPYRVNDVVDIEFDGDTVVSVRLVEGEGEARLKANAELLSSLFGRKKK